MKEIPAKGFEIEVTKLVPVKIKVQISNEMEQFCQLYTTDRNYMGDPTKVYMKVYGEEDKAVATQLAKVLISKDQINQRINQLIEDTGFNDMNVDMQHNYLINQHRDLPTKMKGIEHYNKLKKRTSERVELILPRPIMDWDEEPVKLDESDVKVIETSVIH